MKISIKKIKTIIMCILVIATGIMTGCGSSVGSKDGRLDIVCTTFSQYDWVKQIVGNNDNVRLTLLTEGGTDMHSYQPTVADMALIGSADVFIYVGGESDYWVKDALKNAINKDMKVIKLMEALGDMVKEEQTVEGMQSEHEHEYENESASGDGHSHNETVYDEHVWLSLKNAKFLVSKIVEAVSEADTQNAQMYRTNADEYIEKLEKLDKKYAEAIKAADKKTLVFGDRFPFRYLADDYNLSYYAAFVGCSTESEASFETIAFLSGKIDELGLSKILVIENSDKKIANTVKQNTSGKNQEILVLNSLQSVKKEDINNGFSYLSAMEDNLEILKKAID